MVSFFALAKKFLILSWICARKICRPSASDHQEDLGSAVSSASAASSASSYGLAQFVRSQVELMCDSIEDKDEEPHHIFF